MCDHGRMVVRVEHDRMALAELLSRDPVLHAYQLGDLDDFFWPYTSWFRRGDEVALLYHGLDVPALLAFVPPSRVRDMAALLTDVAAVLPARLHANLSPGLESVVARWYEVSEVTTQHRMALTDPVRLARVVAAGEVFGAGGSAGSGRFLRRRLPG